MTNTKKEIENTQKAIEAIISEILNAKNTLKSVNKSCQDIITMLQKQMTNENWEILAKALMRKQGNQTFYSLYLKNYFEENGVMFVYNVKKDKIFYAGKIQDIKQTYEEWKEERKQERQKASANLSMTEKLKKDFSKIDKLNKNQLEILKSLINEKLKKTI